MGIEGLGATLAWIFAGVAALTAIAAGVFHGRARSQDQAIADADKSNERLRSDLADVEHQLERERADHARTETERDAAIAERDTFARVATGEAHIVAFGEQLKEHKTMLQQILAVLTRLGGAFETWLRKEP